jgi:predicted amidohydrolase
MSKPADSLKVTIIQSNLHWENKEANLAMFEQKLMQVKDNMEIVVLPEMFNTGFSMKPELLAEKMDGISVEWMKRVSKEKKIILAGSLIVEENGNYFNRLIWMQPNGQYGYYDKRHLFAFGGEDQKYSSGSKRLIASVKGWKINLLVCYDLRFPVWARQSIPLTLLADGTFEKSGDENNAAPEYDVLIYVANWPERRNHAWKTLLQARAIENQCYVVGANRVGNDGNELYYSGDSMIVDPLGEVLYTSAYEENIFTCSLPLEKLLTVRAKFPFLKDGDPFIVGN